ncbi:MAG: hypothetical protein Kow0022_15250 [Phycisphaerales bacterium]
MLKFLRKYQLVLLAVGGSLLMVVFLIGPILQRIGPALADKTVATMHGGKRKVSYVERRRAAMEPAVISEVFPFMFGQPARGFPGLILLEDEVDHWFLLKTEAEEAGLVGEADDGRMWLEQELAEIGAVYEKQFQLLQQYGNPQWAAIMMRQPQVQQEIAQRVTDLRSALPANARQVAARHGLPEDEVFKMIAEARGVVRLMRRHDRSVRPSDREIIEAIKKQKDEAVVDFVLIPASRLIDQLPEPTEEELNAHFERFRDLHPGEGELGIGYTLPPRVKLGWLMLDHQAMADSIRPDRIEVRKRYDQNRVKYPGTFEDERPKIEREIVNEQVTDLMVDADRIIQGRLRVALKDVRRVDGYYDIPDNWGGVTMESLAEAIVEDIKAQRGVDIPQPGITYRVDNWFTSDQLGKIPGLGRAYWQIGPQQIPITQLPMLAKDLGGSKQILVQKRIPVAEPYAQDELGNRYYIVLFGTRGESPPDDWKSEIHDMVLEDYKRVAAYERLKAQMDELSTLAQTDGLEAVAARFDSPHEEQGDARTEEDPEAPGQRRLYVSRWATVSRNGVGRIDFSKPLDDRADVEAFREAALAKASQFDPMIPFGELPKDEAVFSVALPTQQAIAIGRVLAFRPATNADRYSMSAARIDQIAQDAFRQVENLRDHYPFTLAKMTERMQFEFKQKSPEEEDLAE